MPLLMSHSVNSRPQGYKGAIFHRCVPPGGGVLCLTPLQGVGIQNLEVDSGLHEHTGSQTSCAKANDIGSFKTMD